MDFIALDIKTANGNRNSVCFIKILVVKDNRRYKEIEYLVKPKDGELKKINIWMHGIKVEDIRDKREFNEIWKDIKEYFSCDLIVTYNAKIKVSILKEVFNLYSIEIPSFKFICINKLIRRVNENSKIVDIEALNKKFNLKSNKLDEALIYSDAFISIIEQFNLENVNDISKKIGIKAGEIGQNYYKPCLAIKVKPYEIDVIHDDKGLIEEKEKIHNINKESFIDEVVVFTRGLNSMKRYEAMEQVRKFGGVTSGVVNKKVTTLVVATNNVKALDRVSMSTKHKKAIDLKERGQKIVILNEEEFLKRLNKIKLNL